MTRPGCKPTVTAGSRQHQTGGDMSGSRHHCEDCQWVVTSTAARNEPASWESPGRASTPPMCGCEECETARQRHNALVANGLISQSRAAGRTYDALQAAHQSSPRGRYVEDEETTDG